MSKRKSYFVREAKPIHTLKFLKYLSENEFLSKEGLEYEPSSVKSELHQKEFKEAERMMRSYFLDEETKSKLSDRAQRAWETRRKQKDEQKNSDQH